MASKYRRIDPRIWGDEKFTELDMLDRLIVLYLLTSTQCNRIGIFKFSAAMAAEELGTTPDEFSNRFAKICETFDWAWDRERKVVFLRSWWKYNHPENRSVLVSCLKDIDDLPKTDLLEEFATNTKYLLTEASREALRQKFSECPLYQDQESPPPARPAETEMQRRVREYEEKRNAKR